MRNRFNYTGLAGLTRPQWMGSHADADDLLPGGSKLDDGSFTQYGTSMDVTLTADAAIGDVALAVSALAAALPPGTVLNFGTAKAAYVTQLAASGATALVVSPLANVIPTASVAHFQGWYSKEVPSGTFVSRTFAQRAAGTGFHPAVAAEDEYFLTAFDVKDVNLDNDVSLLLPFTGFVVKENFLPNIAGITAVGAVLTLLRARYNCTIGSE